MRTHQKSKCPQPALPPDAAAELCCWLPLHSLHYINNIPV